MLRIITITHDFVCFSQRAFLRGGASCLLPRLAMCAHCGSTVSDTWPIVVDIYPMISTRDYIETGDFHNPTSRSSQSYWPFAFLHSRPNGNRIRVWVIPACRVGWSITEQTLTPIVCGAICCANRGLSERTGQALIKTLFVRSFPFPYFPCLPPSSFSSHLYFHIFSRPRLRNVWERLSSLADPGRAWPPNDI